MTCPAGKGVPFGRIAAAAGLSVALAGRSLGEREPACAAS